MTATSLKQSDFWALVGMPSRGRDLYQAIHDGFSCNVFSKLAAISGLEKKQLAEITTIPSASLKRRFKSGFFTEAESDRLYRYAEVYKATLDLFEGDNEKLQTAVQYSFRDLMKTSLNKPAKESLLKIAYATGLPYNLNLESEEAAPYIATLLVNYGYKVSDMCNPPQQ
jgi:putative toxin-antitoxin system antitoxin component (TIGR02293 family)